MAESKYWVWTAKETAELATEKLGSPGPDEIIVKSRYTGISPGTEMALYMMTHVGFPDPNNGYAKYPHRGGYLNVGTVLEAGENVKEEFPAGTWVYSGAGHTERAKLEPHGSLWSVALKLPEELRGPEASFLGMARIGYTAPFMAPAGLGETVAVLGAGLVGNLAAQLYEASGANVVVAERDDFRRGIAEECGLKTVDDIDKIEEYFGGQPQIVVEATGVPQLCVKSFELTAPDGRAVILSSPRGDAPVNFYKHIHAKNITVVGAHGRGVKDSVAALKLMVEMAEAGKLSLKPLVTHMESWQDAPRIWDIYARGPEKRLGTVFDWEK